MKQKQIFPLIALVVFTSLSFAQCTGWNKLVATDSVFTNPAFGNTTTSKIDRLHRSYTYLATVNGGVKVYDNNTLGNPVLVATLPVSSLGNLDAISLYQDSIWLYVALGNIWNTGSQMAGLAIIDVSNPLLPNVSDVYVHSGLAGGAGAVVTRGNYAYLAANQNGLVILNISNKSNIQLISSLTLSNNYPHTSMGSGSMYNARGMGLNGNHAYVCYDRGGLRIIDVSNVNAPVQTNQYCFSRLIDKTTAYNNIAIYGNRAYVAIDYYGMEILDITNPNNVSQIGWWHPATWADTTTDFSIWANSKGHANEIYYDNTCQKVYLAAGKSDAVAIDVSIPSAPETCEMYGSTTDAYGTWGLDFFENKLSVAYIWSVVAPPYSNYTGFKLLQINCGSTGLTESNTSPTNVALYPNPTSGSIQIDTKNQKVKSIKVLGITGELMQEHHTTEFSIQNLKAGLYLVVTTTDQSTFINKVIKK